MADQFNKIAIREMLRQRIAGASTPLPLELRKEVVGLFNDEMLEVMRGHEGYKLARIRDSYVVSLSILKRSVSNLLKMISCFESEVLQEGSTLLSHYRLDRLNEMEFDIQKELFTCANAAKSLIDFATRVRETLHLPDYEGKLKECFGDDGIDKFVIALRVLLHHREVIRANWEIVKDFVAGTQTASFMFRKNDLLRAIEENADKLSGKQLAKAYIVSHPSSINLKHVFTDYARRAGRFNNWLTSELQSNSLLALRDYDSILREKILKDQRMFYRALLGNWLNWQTPPDPHNHLHRYLTAEQLEAIYKLPRNSRAQVDLAISYADQDGVVDDELRQKIYELFCRSEGLHPTINQ